MNSPILVSACLAGVKCRYDGKASPNKKVIDLVKQGKAIPVCPEKLAGLSTPRPPVEKVGKKLLTKTGKDLTKEFKAGAKKALKIAQLAGCKKAILKANSPSCGYGRIYDGSFSGNLTDGNGILADLLEKESIKITSF